MFFGNTPQDTRQWFYTSWAKYQEKIPLEALEQQIVAVIIDHPEYQAILEHTNASKDNKYFPEQGQTNPFLHMGLHLAIREQVATNRPYGIKNIFQSLQNNGIHPLDAEHQLMDCLAECLWQAQRYGSSLAEDVYLSHCQELLRK